MIIIRIRPAVCSVLVGLVSCWVLPCVEAAKPAPDLSAGKAAYEQSCARCHGQTGQGDGRDAKRLYPRPRVFTDGVYKFRSTASGTPPTDDDLFHTLTNGLTAGGMPDWKHLDESVRWQLLYYMKSLSPVFDSTPPQPVPMGHDPGPKHANLAQGRHVYEKLGCASCHGPQGRANGTSAAGLVDNWNRATRPANLTQGWSYRGDSDPNAIYLRLMSGLDGSPMPSYAEAVSPEEAWQLAYYVHSLQQEPHWAVLVHVSHVGGALPDSKDDPRWAAAERVDVRLRNVVDAAGEMTGPQTVTAVSFQALANDEAIRFRLSWFDPSDDRADDGDALALAFRSPQVRGDVVTLQTWPLRDTPALDLCVWSARASQAREAVASRYEPVLQGTATGRTLTSQAAYEDGQWTVVLTRPLAPAGLDGGAELASGRLVPIAFAVWDGGNREQRAVSPWVDLVLTAPRAAPSRAAHGGGRVVWIASAVVLVLALGLVFRRTS